MRMKVIAAGILAVVAAGIAAVALGLVGGESDVADLVPATALAYVDVSLNPSLSQKRAIADLTGRLPDDARKNLTEAIPKGLDSLFDEVHLDYEKDVKPWLGDEAAGFVLAADPEPEGALLLATTDPEAALAAARAAVEKDAGPLKDTTHREVSYAASKKAAVAVVGEFLVVGQPGPVKGVIDAAADGGLSGTQSYSELVGSLEPDRVVTYWVDTPAILDAMRTSNDLSEQEFQQLQMPGLAQFQTPLAGSLFATSETVVAEYVSTKPEDAKVAYAPDDAELLGRSPAGAWVGFVMPSVGENARTLVESVAEDQPVDKQFREAVGLELDDVLAWMGDGVLYVGGNQLSNLSGALAITSSDPAATQTFVNAIVDAGKAQGLAVRSARMGGLEGFELADASVPARVTLLGGHRLVLAVDAQGAGAESTASQGVAGEGETLHDDATFTDATAALGEGYAPMFYLDVKRATQVVKSAFGQSSTPPEFAEAEQYLVRIPYLVAGAREDADRVLQRLVIGTADP